MSRISQLTGKSEPPVRHMRQNSQPSHLSSQAGGTSVTRDWNFSNMQHSIQNTRQNPNPESFYQNLGARGVLKPEGNQNHVIGNR
jgi:hypothetical protein